MAKTQKKRRASRASGKTKTAPRPKAATAANTFLSDYLVVWRHTMDDVPLGLFRTKARALACAKKISFSAGYAVARKLGIDCRTPVCFAVIKFDNGGATEMTVIDRDDDACGPLPRAAPPRPSAPARCTQKKETAPNSERSQDNKIPAIARDRAALAH